MKRLVFLICIFTLLLNNFNTVYASTDDYKIVWSSQDNDTCYKVFSDGTYSVSVAGSDFIYQGDNSNFYQDTVDSFPELKNAIYSFFNSTGVVLGPVSSAIYSLAEPFIEAWINEKTSELEDLSQGVIVTDKDLTDSFLGGGGRSFDLKNILTSSMKDIYNEATGKRIWNGGTERNTDMLKMLQLVFPDADVISSDTRGSKTDKYYVYFLPDDDSYYFGDDVTGGITLNSSNSSITRYYFTNSDSDFLSAVRCVTSDPAKSYSLIKSYYEAGKATVKYLSSEVFYDSSTVTSNTYGSLRFIYPFDIIGYKDFETMLDMKNNFNSPVYFTSNSITNLDEHVENFITNNNYNSNYDYSQLMQNTYNTINNNITQGSDLTAKDVQDIIDNSFNASMEEMKDQLEYLNKTEEERNFELVKNFKELWNRFNNLDEILTLNNGFLSSIDNSMSELLQMDFGGGSTTNIENNIEFNTNIYNDISNYFDNGFTDGTGWNEIQETFKDKFPFCIPWDIMYLFYSFASEPETPSWLWSWNIPLPFEQVYEVNIDINLAPFEPLAKVVRTFTSLFFIIFLINKTKDIIKEEVL